MWCALRQVDNIVSGSDPKSIRAADAGARSRSGSWSHDASLLSGQHQEKLDRLVQLGFPKSACMQALQIFAFDVRHHRERRQTECKVWAGLRLARARVWGGSCLLLASEVVNDCLMRSVALPAANESPDLLVQ